MASIGFLMAIVNLGMLGFTLSVLQRAVELTARTTAVSVAAGGSSTACPTATTVQTIFNNYAAPLIPADATTLTYYSYPTSGSTVVTVSSPWVKASGLNGGYIAINAAYAWKPIGFAFLHGVTLSLTAVAFSTGSASCT